MLKQYAIMVEKLGMLKWYFTWKQFCLIMSLFCLVWVTLRNLSWRRALQIVITITITINSCMFQVLPNQHFRLVFPNSIMDLVWFSWCSVAYHQCLTTIWLFHLFRRQTSSVLDSWTSDIYNVCCLQPKVLESVINGWGISLKWCRQSAMVRFYNHAFSLLLL